MICPGAVTVQALSGATMDLSEDMRGMMITGPHARRISGAHKPRRDLDLESHSIVPDMAKEYVRETHVDLECTCSRDAVSRPVGSAAALGSAGVDIAATRDKKTHTGQSLEAK
jgi:hypothetical protein